MMSTNRLEAKRDRLAVELDGRRQQTDGKPDCGETYRRFLEAQVAFLNAEIGVLKGVIATLRSPTSARM